MFNGFLPGFFRFSCVFLTILIWLLSTIAVDCLERFVSRMHTLFIVTKNGDQPLAVWRMVEKVVYSTSTSGMSSLKCGSLAHGSCSFHNNIQLWFWTSM